MADIVSPGMVAGGPINSGAMPGNYDISIYRGDSLEFFVVLKDDATGTPLDISTSTPKSQLKADYNDQAPVSFDCTLTGVPGQVRFFLSSATTTNLLSDSYIWDFQVTNASGQTRTYLAGDVTVTNEVTK